MQTYVAEIDGRAIFAFRSVDDSCAQAWLDIHGLMRRSLARLESDGRAIWNGRSEILARKATQRESTIWQSSSNRVTDKQALLEQDYVLIWLIDVAAEAEPEESRRKQTGRVS